MSEMITSKEAAELENCDSSWIRRLILGGRLKATKMGNSWVINKKDFAKYLCAKNKEKKDSKG